MIEKTKIIKGVEHVEVQKGNYLPKTEWQGVFTSWMKKRN